MLTSYVKYRERPNGWLAELRSVRETVTIESRKSKSDSATRIKEKTKKVKNFMESFLSMLTPEQRSAFDEGKANAQSTLPPDGRAT
jgi:hypothetical protein